MKKTYIVAMAFTAALAMLSCTRGQELEPAREEGITVKLFVDGMATKGENDILSGYLYLFDNVNAAPFKTVAIGSGTTTLDFATVFGRDADKLERTTVFAVTGGSMQTPTSLENLKKMSIDKPLFLDDSGKNVKADPGPGFYMTAQGKFEKVDYKTTTCNLTLKRLAAKVALELEFPASITKNGNWEFKAGTTYEAITKWTPMTSGENARVYLQNAVSNTKLGAASDPAVLPDPADPTDPTPFTTFTYAPVFMNGATVSAPFYTYPVSWTRGDEKEPFIKLILPWRYETTVEKDGKVVVVDQNVVEFYYKIMFPASITSFEANTYYLPKVKLNILGGEAARPTVIGADGLTIMNWKGVESDEMPAVTINPSDFLVPERETFEVSNGNPLQIKYFASGEVNFTVKEIYKDVYTNDGTARRYIYSTDPSHTYLSTVPIEDTDAVKDRYNREFSGKDDKEGKETAETAWFTNSTFDTKTKSGTLTLNHTLSDDFDLPNFAARPYHYEVELSLKDNSSVKKTITIIQNPPVLVKGEKSTGLVYVNNYTSGFGSSYKAKTSEDPAPSNVEATVYSGYYVNVGEAHRADVSYNERLGRVNTYIYLDPAGNNSCVWRIKVSVAPSDKLFIMDPRDKTLSSVSVPSSPTAEDLSAAAAKSNGLYGLINMHATRSGANYIWNLVGSSLTDTNNSTEQSAIKSYYWPTVKTDASGLTNEQYRPEISPEFMTGSSYGKDGGLSYGGAVNRCMAYQEDGYPAGRWRLPTEAEIDYCINLKDHGAIPSLFHPYYTSGTTTTDVGYWAASGRVLTGDSGWVSNKKSAYVRCVYDTWYWGDQEVAELKTANFGNTSYKQYNWSGYQEKYMNKYYTPAP